MLITIANILIILFFVFDVDSCKSGIGWLCGGHSTVVYRGVVDFRILWEDGVGEVDRDSNKADPSKSMIDW